jgi:purine-binding chemotaxis protein CheW
MPRGHWYVGVIVPMHHLRVGSVSPTRPGWSIAACQDGTAILDPTVPIRPSPTPSLPNRPGQQSALIFVVEGGRYALGLADVLEVTPAAALMSPSGMESMLVGYLDLRGEVLPVLGARELLALPSRPVGLTDRFVVVRTQQRRAAIVVDRIEGVEDVSLIAGAGNDRHDGLTIGRRAGATDGEGLVAFLDLDRLLASSAAGPTEMAAS